MKVSFCVEHTVKFEFVPSTPRKRHLAYHTLHPINNSFSRERSNKKTVLSLPSSSSPLFFSLAPPSPRCRAHRGLPRPPHLAPYGGGRSGADAAVAPARAPHASCSRRIEPWRRAAPATATPMPRRAVAGHLRPLCARRPPHCFPVHLTTHLTSLLLPSVSSQSGRSPRGPVVALLAGFPRSPTPHRQGRPHPLPEPPAPSSFSLLAATPLFFFLLCLEAATRLPLSTILKSLATSAPPAPYAPLRTLHAELRPPAGRETEIP